jgi:uncharacterized protein YcbX
MDIRLSAINLYPVKGIRGISAARADVAAAGLVHDRRWIIVDDEGLFISQRSHPRLALLAGDFQDDQLVLSTPDGESRHLETPDGARRIKVHVWNDHVHAAASDPGTDRWLSRFLDHPCHLAYMDDRCVRPISSSGGRPDEEVSFADGYPCLLVSNASLEDLNSRLSTPLPMDRFRPNLVVEGCDAFAEDGWRRISIGDAVFRNAGPCARCSVTTVDQATGVQTSDEPLRTLAAYRKTEKGVIFGVNLVPENSAVLDLGSPLTILE